MTSQPTTSTLFPYTTLFRSHMGEHDVVEHVEREDGHGDEEDEEAQSYGKTQASRKGPHMAVGEEARKEKAPARGLRSEEHTSELQSRFDLVCRLLLEKKKKR